ncbi:MAG TPA: hypothetical protein VG867_04155 [Rhizomicrobium sp.]|nr:hypothetical protein [Rhizomicrobium sp.]
MACADDVAQQQKPSPEAIADLKTQNLQIVSAEPKANGIFVVQDDGSVRHIQSGLVCPAKYPNVDFYHVLVYAQSGADVGCDYRRADDKGGAWSKLTIFATKAAPGLTLDQAFARYHDEIVQTSPQAVSQGPAIQVGGKAPSDFPEIRSEEFVEPLNDTTYTSQLYVAVEDGWIIEVRATFVGLPNKIEVTKESGTAGAVLEAGDRMMGPKALFDAIGTVGHPAP